MGTTDTLAQHIVAYCKVRGIGTQIIERIELARFHPADALLVCTSTTGMGDLPANITPLYQQLTNESPAIAGRRCAVIALGDSCYPNFAAAGGRFHEALLNAGASSVLLAEVDTKDISEPWAAIESALTQWLDAWQAQVS